MTTAAIMRIEQAEAGTATAYVHILSKEFSTDDDYHVNVLQLERMANAIMLPQLGLSSQSEVAGFFDGEMLGMVVGHNVLGHEWADVLYTNLNKDYLDMYQVVARRKSDSMSRLPTHTAVLSNFRQMVDTANAIVDMTTETLAALPEEYKEYIEDIARQLSTDESVIAAIIAGFCFLMNPLIQEAAYIDEQIAFAKTTDALKDEIDWPEDE